MSGSAARIAVLVAGLALSCAWLPALAQAPAESNERDQAGDRQASGSGESAQLKEGQEPPSGGRNVQAEKREPEAKQVPARDTRADRPERPQRPERFRR